MKNLVKSALSALAILFAQLLSAQTMTDGFNAMQMEDWDKAIAIYTKLSDKNDQKALLSLASAYLAKGDKGKALEINKKAFDANPEGAYAFIALGRQALLSNNPAEGTKQLERAGRSGKKDVDALRMLGETYLYGALRNLTRAEELLKTAYERSTRDVPSLMDLGYCYKEMPKGGDAVQHYEFAEAVDPTNVMATYMKARVYKQARLDEKFIESLAATVAKDKGFTPALRDAAEFWYFKKRNYVKALEAYKSLIANGRDVPIEDEMQLANCYFLNQKYAECVAAVDKILAKDPSKNYLRRLQGYCLYETQQPQKALDVLTEYFKMVPQEKIQASDYEYVAKSRVAVKGDTAVAIEDFRKAIKLDPTTWANRKTIFDLLYAQKKWCESAPEMTLYLDSVPKPEAMDYFRLGWSQYYCKDDTLRYQNALGSFLKVTELAPDAGIGWFWSGKAASKLDPDMSIGTEDAAGYAKKTLDFGKAAPYFQKYIDITMRDTANVAKNKKDLVSAFGYMVYFNYLKANVDNFKSSANQLLLLNPDDPTAKGLLDDFNSRGGVLPQPGTVAEPPAIIKKGKSTDKPQSKGNGSEKHK